MRFKLRESEPCSWNKYFTIFPVITECNTLVLWEYVERYALRAGPDEVYIYRLIK